MNEGWRNLGIVKKLLEELRRGEMEPDIKLLIGEVDGIVRLLLNRCRIIVYQKYENAIRNAKALSELLFRQKFDWALRPSTSDTSTLSTNFLVSTNRASRSNVPSC